MTPGGRAVYDELNGRKGILDGIDDAALVEEICEAAAAAVLKTVPRAGLIKATVQQNVYSSVDGQIGNWTLRTTALVAAVPHSGDSFAFSYGEDSEISETVKQAFVYAGGEVTVDLRSVVTDDPDVLKALAVRLDHGWEVLGGPWG